MEKKQLYQKCFTMKFLKLNEIKILILQTEIKQNDEQ